MEPNEIPQILEAILFVAGEPVAVADLAQALEVSELAGSSATIPFSRFCTRGSSGRPGARRRWAGPSCTLPRTVFWNISASPISVNFRPCPARRRRWTSR